MRQSFLVIGTLALAVACAMPTGADDETANGTTLTNEQIDRAIQKGAKNRKESQCGLRLTDKGRGFMNALTAMGNGMNGTSYATQGGGFKVWIYTAEEWVCQRSFEAAREYRVLTHDELAPEDLANVVRVVAYPDTPTEVRAAGMQQQSSVAHVVIRDARKQQAIQPLAKQPFTEDVQNAMGARLQYVGVLATFDASEVEAIRRLDKKGEFHVTVVGGNEEKNFKVKDQHFARLAGL
jgi:hypothetical protein